MAGAGTLGILMLETRFPRIPGDVGNEKSYDFAVRKRVVRGASTQRVVLENDEALLMPFVRAARELEAEGVSAITTSCGFLAMFQRELAAAVHVPVFTSALLQVPAVAAMLPPGQVVGVLTADARTLGPLQLAGAGIARLPLVIYGMENTAFGRVFVGDQPTLDRTAVERELAARATQMVEEHPEVGAIVLECTNMPPYAAAIQRASGRPVFDILTLAAQVMRSIHPPCFEQK